MFNSLPQFYQSDIWRSFRAGLIHDRINPADGVLYDEYNGEPLVNSYDIVAHHKQPLTMKNVNDYSISLNPDNIMIVSQRSHNEIHARFGYCTERKVYYVYGPPCSGKTTFVKSIRGNSDIVADMDNVWESITGGSRYEKPAALKQCAFTVRDCIYDMIRRRAGKWERAFIITGGAVKSIREREINSFGAEAVFIDTSEDECYRRLASDSTRTGKQKEELTQYIKKWFEDYNG